MSDLAPFLPLWRLAAGWLLFLVPMGFAAWLLLGGGRR